MSSKKLNLHSPEQYTLLLQTPLAQIECEVSK